MSNFNLNDFKANKTVVNCKTEQEAIGFFNYLSKNGIKTLDDTKFDVYKEKTCYDYDPFDNSIVCCSVKFYTIIGRTIVNASLFNFQQGEIQDNFFIIKEFMKNNNLNQDQVIEILKWYLNK